MPKRREIRNSTAEFLIFQVEGKEQGVEVYYKDKTVWCTQKAMGMLFDCSSDNIGLHLKNIFASGELVKETVTEKISATASDGKNYMTQFYNLDAVISVGYRVNSGGNEVLQTSGRVTAEEAKEHAKTEFEKYRIIQDRMFISDFDRFLGELPFEDGK